MDLNSLNTTLNSNSRTPNYKQMFSTALKRQEICFGNYSSYSPEKENLNISYSLPQRYSPIHSQQNQAPVNLPLSAKYSKPFNFQLQLNQHDRYSSLLQEGNNLKTDLQEHIDSLKQNDRRYRRSSLGITTNQDSQLESGRHKILQTKICDIDHYRGDSKHYEDINWKSQYEQLEGKMKRMEQEHKQVLLALKEQMQFYKEKFEELNHRVTQKELGAQRQLTDKLFEIKKGQKNSRCETQESSRKLHKQIAILNKRVHQQEQSLQDLKKFGKSSQKLSTVVPSNDDERQDTNAEQIVTQNPKKSIRAWLNMRKREQIRQIGISSPAQYNQSAQTTHSYSRKSMIFNPGQEKQSSSRKRILRIADPIRMRWDLFVMVLAIWNCFITPFEIAFQPDLADQYLVIVIEFIIDIFFFIDIFLNFRTTFYSSTTGDEIFEPRIIAKNYLAGKFWIDLISCIPSDLLIYAYYGEQKKEQNFDESSILTLLGLLKLYRISRLNRIIIFMRAKTDVKMAIRIAQLFFFLIMYIHLVACAWWVVIVYDELWIPPTDFMYIKTDMYDLSIGHKYWFSFYHSILMLTSGEIGPRSTLHSAFCGIMILLGALITAVMFGDMALLMSNLNMRQSKFQEIQNAVNTAMKNMGLPENLQQSISDYLLYTEASLANSEEFENFRKCISPSLYKEVLSVLYNGLIAKNDLFKDHQNIQEFIIPRLHPRFNKPEQIIVNQWDQSEDQELYFIARGDCEVLVRLTDEQNESVRKLRIGEHFGEVSLLTNGIRTSTVRSLNYALLAALSQSDFKALVNSIPYTKSIFRRRMKKYRDRFKLNLLRMIQRVPYLHQLNTNILQELQYMMKLVNVEEGKYILKPGRKAENILFLLEGQLSVSVTLNDKDLYNRRRQIFDISSDKHFDLTPQETFLKAHTEIYPLYGTTGAEGAIHMSQLEQHMKNNILGKYCVELELETIGPGSNIGAFTTLMNDTYLIQVKAISDCKIFCIHKTDIQAFRQNSLKFSNTLGHAEVWAKSFWIPVDDFTSCNSQEDDLIQGGISRAKRVFRSAVLRIIKENREKRILDTPMIALMLKDIEKRQSIQNTNDLKKHLNNKGISLNPQALKMESTIKNLVIDVNSLKQEVTQTSLMVQEIMQLMNKEYQFYTDEQARKFSIGVQTEEEVSFSSIVPVQQLTPEQSQYFRSQSNSSVYRTVPFNPKSEL